MFILSVNVVSNDGKYFINATSNNIRVVSANLTDNSLYYYNLELKFNGTFNQSLKYNYITTIYNYFLQTYNAQLIGPIDSMSGSILFGAGLNLANSTFQDIVTERTLNDSDLILPGSSLTWFLLDNYEANITGNY